LVPVADSTSLRPMAYAGVGKREKAKPTMIISPKIFLFIFQSYTKIGDITR